MERPGIVYCSLMRPQFTERSERKLLGRIRPSTNFLIVLGVYEYYFIPL